MAGSEPSELAHVQIKAEGQRHTVLVNGVDVAPYLEGYTWIADVDHDRFGHLELRVLPGRTLPDIDGTGVVEVIGGMVDWLDRLDGEALDQAILAEMTAPLAGGPSYGEVALTILKKWASGE